MDFFDRYPDNLTELGDEAPIHTIAVNANNATRITTFNNYTIDSAHSGNDVDHSIDDNSNDPFNDHEGNTNIGDNTDTSTSLLSRHSQSVYTCGRYQTAHIRKEEGCEFFTNATIGKLY